jgi:hypothetical protein
MRKRNFRKRTKIAKTATIETRAATREILPNTANRRTTTNKWAAETLVPIVCPVAMRIFAWTVFSSVAAVADKTGHGLD